MTSYSITADHIQSIRSCDIVICDWCIVTAIRVLLWIDGWWRRSGTPMTPQSVGSMQYQVELNLL